jgi:hypothetical protein
MKFGENGHKGGRPKGVRNQLTTEVVRDILADWKEGGAAAVRICRIEEPATYFRVVTSILPKELLFEVGSPLTELTDEQLTALIEQRLRELAQEPMKVIDAKPVNGGANYEA